MWLGRGGSIRDPIGCQILGEDTHNVGHNVIPIEKDTPLSLFTRRFWNPLMSHTHYHCKPFLVGLWAGKHPWIVQIVPPCTTLYRLLQLPWTTLILSGIWDF